MVTPILSSTLGVTTGFTAEDEVIATAPLWEVVTYQGLFHPGTTYYVHAESKYHAECLASEQMTHGEWFPTFSACRVAPDTASELLIPTTIHQ
ncbi:hypothetical protein [Microbacterium sp.]|uniref:hypothetical protein n=1 Tax=Microbacterium sp. TaxID=51671 RepID=UPI0039E491C8